MSALDTGAGGAAPADDDPEAVAVIGLAGRFPRSRSVAELWDHLCAGRECLDDLDEATLRAAGVPAATLTRPDYVRRAATVPDYDAFDAEFFGLPPSAAAAMDPQQRLFLQTCWHALEDAGYDPARQDGPIGVFGASSFSGYLPYHVLSQHDPRELLGRGTSTELIHTLTLNDAHFLATRVAHALDLRGPALTVQTACSSSLVAVHLACQSLLSGESQLALAGGMTVKVPHRAGYLYEPGSMLSEDGYCRPFDAAANGTVFGSGGGVVLLKRLSDALADRDPVRAVIGGSAINNDGSLKMGYTAPSVEMQAAVVAEALAVAGVEPDAVGYVEAHGTGTPLGDPVELAALRQALDPEGTRTRRCLVGSVKGNIGHLEAASGVVGLIKTVLALEQRTLPGTAHFTRPHPELRLDRTPFTISAEPVKWPSDEPLVAGVSSLGVGGTNAHVVLWEAPARPATSSPARAPAQVLLLSARDTATLRATQRAQAQRLADDPGVELADAAFTLAEGRQAFGQRRAVVATRLDQAAKTLAAASDGVPALTDPPSVVLLFPGQGAQYRGMARGLYPSQAVFRHHFDRCATAFRPLLRADLRDLVFGDGTGASRRTDHAQPALFAVEYALAHSLAPWGVHPDVVAGHSVGEFAAACLAGVLDLDTAAALVAARGRLMHAAPPGAMLTVRLPEAEVRELLVGTGLELAAVNEPGACVVAGAETAVARFAESTRAREVPCQRLRTAHAFHTSAMAQAAERFAELAATVPFSPPTVPMLCGVTGGWLSPDEAVDPGRWARQLRAPVRWANAMDTVLEQPGRVLVEVGPGRALTGTARRGSRWSAAHRAVCVMRHARQRADDHETLLRALGALWEAGVPVDWTPARGGSERRISLPGYPFRASRHWIESAHPAAAHTTAAHPVATRTSTAGPDAPADRRSVADPRPVAPAPSGGPVESVAEAGSIEDLLTSLWARVLGEPSVGPGDDFFALGGDSVLATQIAARARSAGLRIQPRDVFAHPTPAALAAVTSRRDARPRPARRAAGPATPDPLTPSAWDLLPPPGHPASPPVTVRLALDATLDPALVTEALRRVRGHHAVLGAHWVARAGVWEARGGLGPVEADGLVPMAARLVDEAADRPRLELSFQPELLDGAARRLLLGDLLTACHQLSAGRDVVALPEVPTPWGAWARHVQELVHDDRVHGERAHWLAQARQHADPRGAAPPARCATPARLLTFLSPPVTRALRRAGAARRVTVTELLLAAVSWAHAPVVAGREVVVEVQDSLRRAAGHGFDLSRTVGCFTSRFPLRLPLADTVSRAVDEARDRLRRVPRHGLGYGVLRRLHAPSAEALRALPGPDLGLYPVVRAGFQPPRHGPLQAPPEAENEGLHGQEAPAGDGVTLALHWALEHGQLKLLWWYDPSRRSTGDVTDLAERTRVALRDLAGAGGGQLS